MLSREQYLQQIAADESEFAALPEAGSDKARAAFHKALECLAGKIEHSPFRSFFTSEFFKIKRQDGGTLYVTAKTRVIAHHVNVIYIEILNDCIQSVTSSRAAKIIIPIQGKETPSHH